MNDLFGCRVHTITTAAAAEKKAYLAIVAFAMVRAFGILMHSFSSRIFRDLNVVD